MTTTYAQESSGEDLRASAIVLHYAASLFVNAAHAAGDESSLAAGQSIIELLTQVMPESNQLPS